MRSFISHIRSQDCYKIDGNSDNIVCSLSEAITCSEDEEIFVEVINVSIPFSFYNINFSNKYLNIKETDLNNNNPQFFTIVLEEGNFSATQISQLLKIKLNEASPKNFQYDLIYNKYTNKLTFVLNSANAKATFLFSSGQNSRFDCQFVLGFKSDTGDISFQTGQSLTSNSTMNVSSIESIYIHSNLGITNQYESSSKNISSILMKIPVNNIPFSYIQWENTANIKFISSLQVIQNIELALRDMDKDRIDLNNNDWYISIRFDIHRKSEDRIFRLKRDQLIDVEIADEE